MAAEIISGKEVAADVRASVKAAVEGLPGQPTLAVVLVGEDPASQVYVRNKVRQTEECGMRSLHHHLPKDATQFEVENLISDLNNDDEVDGILLQLPLPKGLDEAAAIEKIDPDKDVDGLTETSAGRLTLGKPGMRPCTPTGLAQEHLRRHGGAVAGRGDQCQTLRHSRRVLLERLGEIPVQFDQLEHAPAWRADSGARLSVWRGVERNRPEQRRV